MFFHVYGVFKCFSDNNTYITIIMTKLIKRYEIPSEFNITYDIHLSKSHWK